jgi:hypothetical protein
MADGPAGIPTDLPGGHVLPAIGDLSCLIAVGRYGCYWLRLKPADGRA